MLPYLTVPIALWLVYSAVSSPNESGVADMHVVVSALAVLALVLVRQGITLRAYHRLGRSLAALSLELEDRVLARTQELKKGAEDLDRRTEELNALNRVARDLSRCATSQETLSVGVRAACDAVGMSAGAVWLAAPDGTTRLSTSHAVSQEAVPLVAELPNDVSDLVGAAAGNGVVVAGKGDREGNGRPSVALPWSPGVLVAAPLIARGTPLGLLAVIGNDGHEVARSRLSLLEAIGAEMGVALESAQRYEQALYLADWDPITGLLNHRAFHRRLREEMKRHQRTRSPFALVMMDVDGFKLFNVTHGHLAGDQVLKEIAEVLAGTARETDAVARYGGDEFAAILPETGIDGALVFAKRAKETLSNRPFMASGDALIPLRLSFGVSTFPEDGLTPHDLVGRADTNLYASKDMGGDAITAGSTAARELARAGTFGVLDGLVTAIDNKDRYTRRHSQQVTDLAVALGESLGLSDETQRALRIAGLLHDVGKIGIPDRLLRKPGRLDEEEYAAIKQHATLGEIIVKGVPNVVEVVGAIGAHHERWDGQGYPRGLKGGEIPYLGRILAVADAYSAMTSDRPYRKRLTREEAREELLRAAGSQLDPALVDAFITLGLGDEQSAD